MKFLLVVAVLFAVAHAASVQEQWQEYKLKYGKTYRSLLDEKRRFAIFQDKLRQFDEHNARFANGQESYQMGVNKFTDWTQEEQKAYLSPMKPKLGKSFVGLFNKTSSNPDPEPVDWRTKGVVTDVKDQGDCGSCWAFSATAGIEGATALKTGQLVVLSEQSVVDCSTQNDGCDGGLMEKAFDDIKQIGIDTEAKYPYKGVDGVCQMKKGQYSISGHVELAQSEDVLLEAVSTKGPICVAIDATCLFNYFKGVLDSSCGCGDSLDHGVTLVGHGKENGVNYWLIKNSWGSNWGDGGYFKLVRGKKACGIYLDNSYPVV